jgi:hypothetical protein
MAMTFQDAQRKARFGHRPWVCYRDRSGVFHAYRATADTVKAALIACGTQQSWTLLCGDGTPMRITWRLGLTVLANAKHGYLS